MLGVHDNCVDHAAHKELQELEEDDSDTWVRDSSVDHKGSTPLRSSTGVWRASLFILATGGFKPCLESFGADQFDDNNSRERKQKMSYFNWWSVAISLAVILGVNFIVYAEDNVGWGVAFLILTVVMALTIIVFYFERTFYRYRVTAKKTPLTPMLQVFVAAFANRRLPYPPNSSLLFEVSDTRGLQGRHLCHTKRFRFLDKASILIQEKDVVPAVAIHQEKQKQSNPWKLAAITQVEELKLILNIIPIWLTSMIIGVNHSQSYTFFVKQGSVMNRTITSHFELPPASTCALSGIGMMISISLYDLLLVPFLRRVTKTEQGITILKRIGIGMAISTLSVVVASLVESKRLSSNVMLSVFWLAPQFLILGIGEGFVLVGLQEYFYEEMPDSMRSLGMALYLSVIGIGSFLSSLLITVVNSVTNKYGSSGWIGKDANHSRLDLFSWVLAALNGVNLVCFVTLASKYTYKNVKEADDDVATRSCL